MFLSVPRSKQMFEVFRGTLSWCMDHIWENVYILVFVYFSGTAFETRK